jgi:hypothetical protein
MNEKYEINPIISLKLIRFIFFQAMIDNNVYSDFLKCNLIIQPYLVEYHKVNIDTIRC